MITGETGGISRANGFAAMHGAGAWKLYVQRCYSGTSAARAPSRLDHVLVPRRAFSSIRSDIMPQGSISRDALDHNTLIAIFTMLAGHVQLVFPPTSPCRHNAHVYALHGNSVCSQKNQVSRGTLSIMISLYSVCQYACVAVW